MNMTKQLHKAEPRLGESESDFPAGMSDNGVHTIEITFLAGAGCNMRLSHLAARCLLLSPRQPLDIVHVVFSLTVSPADVKGFTHASEPLPDSSAVTNGMTLHKRFIGFKARREYYVHLSSVSPVSVCL